MKKAQIQSGESITVVIIVMILIIIGLVYLSNFRTTQTQSLLEDESDLDILSTSLRISNMEEFTCTSEVATIGYKCFDYFKVKAFKNLQDDPYYIRRMGNVNLTLIIYDDLNTTLQINESINFFDNLQENRRIERTFYPINVYHPVDKKTYFAILEVSVQ